MYSEIFKAMKHQNEEAKSITKQLEKIPAKFIIWMDEGI